MYAKLLILIGCAVHVATADEATNTAVSALQNAGARVRRATDGSFSVDFHLRGRNVTAETLRQLQNLPRVTVLNLRDTKVTSPMLREVNQLPHLERLHLERTVVDDSGISHLVKLKKLSYLNVYQTRITDKAIEHLARIRSLRSLYVWNSRLTKNGMRRLRSLLPDTKIIGGVDLAAMPAEDLRREVDRPNQKITWMPFDGDLPPRSIPGTNTRIVFENKSSIKVRVYWVSYSNELVLYATLKPGDTRDQNTFSDASWLITDLEDQPLGWFRTGNLRGLAIIPLQ